MRTLRKTMLVTALVAAMVLATVGVAVAAEPEVEAPLDLEALKARVIEQIDARIANFEDRLEDLEGREGPLAEQLTALFTQGIADFEQLKADVAAATTAGEVRRLVHRAYQGFAAHARVRTFYAHVETDLLKFDHRLDLLYEAIARAEEAGLDTNRATEQAEAAATDLDTAAEVLAGVDPGAIGDGTMAQLRAAHRTAHAAQRHLRAGFRSLAAQVV